jgi:hypothetical protein
MLELLPRDPAKLAKFVIDIAAGEIESKVRGPLGAEVDASVLLPHSSAPAAGATLDRKARTEIIELLCEDHSLGEAARLSGASEEAVGALMSDAGEAAAWYQERVLRHLPCRRIRLDPIVTFADTWTWIAIDEETRLIPCWRVGARDGGTAIALVKELAPRLAHAAKLVDDRFNAYLEALEGASDCDIDVAILHRLFGARPQASEYSEEAAAKIARHAHAVALFALYHNFVRVHRAPLTAPAAAADVIAEPWTIPNIVDLLEMREQLKTGPWYERLVVLRGR